MFKAAACVGDTNAARAFHIFPAVEYRVAAVESNGPFFGKDPDHQRGIGVVADTVFKYILDKGHEYQRCDTLAFQVSLHTKVKMHFFTQAQALQIDIRSE